MNHRDEENALQVLAGRFLRLCGLTFLLTQMNEIVVAIFVLVLH